MVHIVKLLPTIIGTAVIVAVTATMLQKWILGDVNPAITSALTASIVTAVIMGNTKQESHDVEVEAK